MCRTARTVFSSILFLLLALGGLQLVNPASAGALCATPPEDGVWWGPWDGDGPSKLEIHMVKCGDQVLNGVQTTTQYHVDVWKRQSDGSLYHRGTFVGDPVRAEGVWWIVARVPVGGYVEELWLRATDHQNPAQSLRVWIDHESLDSKPSYATDTTFGRVAPKDPLLDRVRIRPSCLSCIIGG